MSAPDVPSTDAPRNDRRHVLATGLLSGVIAAFAMLLVFGVLRLAFGVPSPPESIPDRIAPLIPIMQFFGLFMVFHGYNGLKQFGVLSILAGMIVVGLALGALYAARVARRGARPSPIAVLGGALALVWLVSLLGVAPVLDTSYRGLAPMAATAATAVGWFLAYLTFGVVLVLVYRLLAGMMPAGVATSGGGQPIARRRVLAGAIGVIGAATTFGIVRALNQRAVFGYDGTQYRGMDLQPITPNDRFYSVTKNVVDPAPAKAIWRLAVRGAVARGRDYTFDDLTALPGVEQETTLMCISNGIDGGLMSNARWRGVPLTTVLNAAALAPGVVEVKLSGADGYTDTIPIAKALDPTTLLVYAMNGEPIPAKHGYPVRVIVPGMYGEKNVKWVTQIEPVVRPVQGFYEQQGWGPDFTIHPRARIDVPDAARPLPSGEPMDIRGVAFAGDRGVSRVEVSTDDGKTWQDARIEYPGTRLSWAFWRFPWRPDHAGDYRVVARATDGMGVVQSGEFHDIVAQGARGYHRVTLQVR